MVELHYVTPHGTITTEESLRQRFPGWADCAIRRFLDGECKLIRFELIEEDKRCK